MVSHACTSPLQIPGDMDRRTMQSNSTHTVEKQDQVVAITSVRTTEEPTNNETTTANGSDQPTGTTTTSPTEPLEQSSTDETSDTTHSITESSSSQMKPVSPEESEESSESGKDASSDTDPEA